MSALYYLRRTTNKVIMAGVLGLAGALSIKDALVNEFDLGNCH